MSEEKHVMAPPRNERIAIKPLVDEDGKIHTYEERQLLILARIADGIEMQNSILKSIDSALRRRK